MLRRPSLFTLALLAASGAAAETAPPETLWANACARCHRDAGAVVQALRSDPDAASASALDSFLAGHHVRDAEDRAALVAWLQAQARE